MSVHGVMQASLLRSERSEQGRPLFFHHNNWVLF